MLNNFENKLVDGLILVMLLLSISIALFLARHLAITPAPITVAARVLTYLMEVDSTTCFGQNTLTKRNQK